MPIYIVTLEVEDGLLSPRERPGRLRGRGKTVRGPRAGSDVCWVEAVDGRDAISWLLNIPGEGTDWWTRFWSGVEAARPPLWCELSDRKPVAEGKDHPVFWNEDRGIWPPVTTLLRTLPNRELEMLVYAKEDIRLARTGSTKEIYDTGKWPPPLDGEGPRWAALDPIGKEFRRLCWQKAVNNRRPLGEELTGREAIGKYRVARSDGQSPEDAFKCLYDAIMAKNQE